MEIFCPSCKHPLKEDYTFCENCNHFKNQIIYGTVLNRRFKVEELTRPDRMGIVYRATDKLTGKPCTLKQMFIYEENKISRDYVEKHFRGEIKLLIELNHPCLPKILDFFKDKNDYYYLAIEYIEGLDLETYTEKNGPSSEEKVIKWALEICKVLSYLHNRPEPIIHRDITPSNIVLREKDNHLMIVDFGYARTINPHTFSKKTAIKEEIYYSVEQCQGYPEIRSDIYSLGATMHFLLTGKTSRPFRFLPVREIKPYITEHMEKVIKKSLSFSSEERFASAEEMAMAISGELNFTLPEEPEPAVIKKTLEEIYSDEKEAEEAADEYISEEEEAEDEGEEEDNKVIIIRTRTPAHDAIYKLTVIAGKNEKETFFIRDKEKKIIGKKGEGSHDIDLEDPEILSRHASLTLEESFICVNLEDRRGELFANDEAIVKKGLIDGDLIKLGNTILKYETLNRNILYGSNRIIEVIEGLDKGKKILVKNNLILGRKGIIKPAAEKLELLDRSLQTEHAVIKKKDKKFYLINKNSKNITLLNGIQITEPKSIRKGDQIRLGNNTLLLLKKLEAPYVPRVISKEEEDFYFSN